MFEKLELVRMAQAMASHAAARQGVVARNVANADTPGYKAMDIADFATVYDAGAQGDMRASRPGHFGVSSASMIVKPQVAVGAESPNGNSVSLEIEMVNAAEVRQEHDMALSIYSATSDILRLSLGRKG